MCDVPSMTGRLTLSSRPSGTTTTKRLPCTNGEVRTFVRVDCTLRPDNTGVRVVAYGELCEDDECRFDDHDGESVSDAVDVPVNESREVAVDVENDEEGDEDPSHLSHESDWASVHNLTMTKDLDGQTPAKGLPPLTFTLDECVESEGCAQPLTMEVNNIDEGDDSGEIAVQFFNEQAP